LRKVRKYFYNTTTHRYEKFVLPLRTRVLRGLSFISASLVTALIMVALAYRFLPSPGEKRSLEDINRLREQYSDLQARIAVIDTALSDLEERDDNIYRSIFEAPPLPDSIRKGKFTPPPAEKYRYAGTGQLLEQVNEKLQQLRNRIDVQQLSYDTLEHLVKTKEDMLACIPAIQPVSNKDLSHIASGFGYRIDPIYKTPKMHTGLDYAAAIGTPIYATANGRVESTSFEEKGYGNHVIINHGYGYETLYGHMVRVNVRPGQVIRRGEVIGWVGSTGKSTGPHCHYEVIRNGEKIDPVHYLFNDLTASEYDRLVKMAAASNQSFD
jgi:murein DD-endopeptidase MepM/ murein hydrolase activator NlpD